MAALDGISPGHSPFMSRMPSSRSEQQSTQEKEQETQLAEIANELTYCVNGECAKEDFDPIPSSALANETFPGGLNPNDIPIVPKLADPPSAEQRKASVEEEPKESVKRETKGPVIRRIVKALPDGVDSSNRFFSDSEWNQRVEMVQNLMKKEGTDVIVITSPANIFWLSGFHTTGYYFFQCMVVPAYEEPFAMVRQMEGTGVQARTCLDHCYVFQDTEDPIETLVELLKKKVQTKNVVGYEEDSYFFPAKQQRQFTRALSDINFVDCSGLVEKCRRAKSPAEIEVMKLAGKATEAAMEAGLNSIAVGRTENNVAAEVYKAAFDAGGEYPACPSFIASGPRGYIGHATWEGRQLKEGDTVFLEIGGCKYRYHTAMMRTAYIGWEIPPKMKEMEKIFDRCLTECMKAMKPGVPIKDIDAMSKKIISNNSYGIETKNRFGYSLGVAFSPGWG